MAPSPELRERMRASAREARRGTGLPDDAAGALLRQPRRLAFDDGVLRPPDAFPPGASRRQVRGAAHDRSPLRGRCGCSSSSWTSPDKRFDVETARFSELFFSTGSLATGSVTEYYTKVTGGLVQITGEVVGPYTLPQPLAWYANGNFGIGNPTGDPRANVMAADALAAADPAVDLIPYDNDGDGYVDAFVVVHAGRGGEETGDSGDIWSHKWVLPQEQAVDGTKVYAYLTIPEDAKLGVSAHELGHLLLGFPVTRSGRWPDLSALFGRSCRRPAADDVTCSGSWRGSGSASCLTPGA